MRFHALSPHQHWNDGGARFSTCLSCPKLFALSCVFPCIFIAGARKKANSFLHLAHLMPGFIWTPFVRCANFDLNVFHAGFGDYLYFLLNPRDSSAASKCIKPHVIKKGIKYFVLKGINFLNLYKLLLDFL